MKINFKICPVKNLAVAISGLLVITVGCTNAESGDEKTVSVKTVSTDAPARDTVVKIIEKPVIIEQTIIAPAFLIQVKESDENPTSLIQVSFNGHETHIANISGKAALIGKSEYKDKGIPADAIAACGAWWAGAGDYFYQLMNNNIVQVYQGFQDETKSGNDYHWKKVKELM